MLKYTGYILLYRAMAGHWLYPTGREFTEWEAWLDMELQAAYEDHETCLDGASLRIEVGCFPTSINRLSQAWGWTRPRVERFLKRLQQEGMIELTKATRNVTILKLSHYARLQGKSDIQNTTIDTTNRSTTKANGHTTYKKKEMNKEKRNNLDFSNDDAWMKGALGYGDS